MICALVLLAATAKPSIGVISGSAVGFAGNDPHFYVEALTKNGVAIKCDDVAYIDSRRRWVVSFVANKPMSKDRLEMTISADGYLRHKYRIRTSKSGLLVAVVKIADLTFGDLNGDNKISDEDVALVSEALGIKKGDSRWIEDIGWNSSMNPGRYFDFNHDGVIDVKDVALVRANLGKKGD